MSMALNVSVVVEEEDVSGQQVCRLVLPKWFCIHDRDYLRSPRI